MIRPWRSIFDKTPPPETRVLIGNRRKVRIAVWRAQDDAYGAGWWEDERGYYLGLTFLWWQPLPARPVHAVQPAPKGDVHRMARAGMESGGVHSMSLVNPGSKHRE